MPNKNSIFLLIAIITIALTGVLTGCTSAEIGGATAYPLAPVSELPDEIQIAPPVVREAYQFAVANPETLQELPCYCGCGDMGHTSNYACYVQNRPIEGEITFDTHALGCSICVDITQDAMRLINEGKSLAEIRVYVDDAYSQYGPSNIMAE